MTRNWTTWLRIEVDDLRGGTMALRIQVRLEAQACDDPKAVEAAVGEALSAKCSYVCSKFSLLPEDLLGSEARLQRESVASIASAAVRHGVAAPACEILAIERARDGT